MHIKRNALFFAGLLAALAALSCAGEEQEAKRRMLQAQPMINRGDWMGLKGHLETIIADYPETKAAETARQMRESMVSRVNGLAETVLKQAIVTAIACQASYPGSDITLERLRSFGFNAAQDVVVEVDRPQADDFLISAWHPAGDLVWYGGPDGRTRAEAMEE